MENLFRVDDIKVDMPSKVLSDNVAKIAVIGVGGGGCNMINHMINEGSHKIDLIAANTDLQVLHISKAPKKIQLGLKLTKGLGAGMKPEIGRDSAVESYEEIKGSLKGADIVFIAAGLGGGTGTGAAAIIAKAAKEIGALTVSVVTKPFTWEGKKRAGLANLGLEELKKVSDSIIIVPNDRLLEIIDENVGMKDAFKIIDNILYQAVNGMSEVILNPGNSDINTDFADVKTIMQHKGMALMGIGRAKGENAAQRALEDAIDSPLLDKVSLNGAKGILIHFNIHPQVSLFAINDVMGTINERMDSNAEIIFGTTSDSTLEKDEVKITIVATGFESRNEEFDEPQEVSEEQEQNNNAVMADSENYLDIPPLMRDYIVQYQLN
ncbi:cell division protein FtsZ [Arcobacter ellisii]|jgi:cell division protein FtsZ|uniref:Cell division protein FtsZ n=1 Tax=Arcobacter ellisii TaxID=913109 RepID=A0A347U7J1_9BACT|nr:cell division protein FtsZ [Arcobacter ellisii]AXX94819.1 cell division protein FtsZ [Arcobacter ellisii]MBD3830220.1 cell division protein FtsZ [Arcobacter sp.]RXI30583.1 cell division protein FtsZ [Arcobacter ellisii]